MISNYKTEMEQKPLQFIRIHTECCFLEEIVLNNSLTPVWIILKFSIYGITHQVQITWRFEKLLPGYNAVARNKGIWHGQSNHFQNSLNTSTHTKCQPNMRHTQLTWSQLHFEVTHYFVYTHCNSYQKLLKMKSTLFILHMISLKRFKKGNGQKVVAATTLFMLPCCLF